MFQPLHLRSARIPFPYNTWELQDNNEEEAYGVYVRSWFGQRVLWCRYQDEANINGNNHIEQAAKDENNSCISTTNVNDKSSNPSTSKSRQKYHQPDHHVGRHLTCGELEPYRMVGDAMVDELLEALKDAGMPVQAGDDLLQFCQKASEATSVDSAGIVENVVTESSSVSVSSATNASSSALDKAHKCAATFWNMYHPQTLSSWADVEQLRRGQQVFLAYTPAMSYALYYRSFVPGFSIPKIAQVLRTTGYLTPIARKNDNNHHQQQQNRYIHRNKHERVQERLMDTGAFLAACMGLDVSELMPGQQAWRTILNVRFLHGKVRHALRKRRDWNMEEWGVPINAEDMAATLLAFSTNTLLGLEFLLGFPLSRRDREDYLALWRYIGWLLGVDVQSNPSVTIDTNGLSSTMTTVSKTQARVSSLEEESRSKCPHHVRLRPLDPCGPGWIPDTPDTIEHSNAMLQSIILHILHPDDLSVAIANHLLRLRQKESSKQQQQHQQQSKSSRQHLPSSSKPKTEQVDKTESNTHKTTHTDNSVDSSVAQQTPEAAIQDNLWYYYRALQCRRFIGDPLADALHLPLHSNWWKRQWLYVASTCCLLLVRCYTCLALPGSPLRPYMMRYHQNGLKQFWIGWLEAHPRRMAQALAVDGKGKAKSAVDSAADENLGNHNVCPFAMVAPPVY